MTCGRHRAIAIAAALGAALLLGLAAAPARAQSFSDVTSKCWAHSAIAYVTNKGPANHKIDFLPGAFDRAVVVQLAQTRIFA